MAGRTGIDGVNSGTADWIRLVTGCFAIPTNQFWWFCEVVMMVYGAKSRAAAWASLVTGCFIITDQQDLGVFAKLS